ncbi:extracellular solute-binding protein [Vallitalea pronyensis]|uniref:Extracellular solute-binding protein n=1 Tax=Vallitalea pronyensis TaxID=1348613 RepID=A0A8J8MND4_9FIRM|nr:extracellular solute-binding protein [Vallitalea pronyensis]QUI24684.1 extracellular solute-binding protein [Vallitalea pronyensis]
MKRYLTMLLALIVTMSLVFTGCGSKKAPDEETSGNNAGTTSSDKDKDNGDTASEEKLSFPLKERVKLTAFVHTRPNVDNFDENAMTKYIEEKTNIDLEFVVATNNEAQEKLNLLLATGDYPDLILTSQLTSAQQSLYGSQGSLVALNDLIEKYGTNTKKVFDLHPIARERVTMPDGNIYNLPTISECYHCLSTQKLWIYKPWLDKLELDMPQTTEEFYNVLKAFATQDPNGNGIADEIPMAGAYKGWEAEPEAFLMNSFVYNPTRQGGAMRLFVDNGTVKASYFTDGWKEGLKYMQRLRKEGLLAEESFTQAPDGLKQMGENPDVVILGAFPGGFPGTGTDLSGERYKDYITVPPLEGPDGVRIAKYSPYASVRAAFSITNACKHPEVAMMLADLLYGDELSLWNSNGQPGIDWEYIDDDNKLGINGEKASWASLIQLADQKPNGLWNQMGNYYNPSHVRLGRYQEDPENMEVILYRETKKNYEPYWPSTDILLPPLTLTEEQSAELLTYSTSINEYVLEKIAEFVLTDVNIDEVWDSYKAELEGMGINQMLKVYQEAYDTK